VKRYASLVTPEAEAGIVSAFEYINEHSPENAAKWLRGLYREINTLETVPERCSLAREGTLRHPDDFFSLLLYVRHGRQKTVGERDHEAVDDEE
jgi:hypothetical protein